MAKKKDLSGSIKKVMFVYLVLLVGLGHGAEEPQVDLYPPSEEDSKGGMFL